MRQLVFAPLFSGSSGNATYISDGRDAVIADAGVSASRILAEIGRLGLDVSLVRAIVATHEHSDHVSGIGPLARKLDVPIFATRGTWEGMGRQAGKLNEGQRRVIEAGSGFSVGDMDILSFPTPHDANESCGYVFSLGRVSAAIATDIGHINENWLSCVSACGIVLLEADYDREMLLSGPYPFELKRRIQGKKGHLSNDDAAGAAFRLCCSGTRQIILGHMSKINNFPELALKTVENALADEGVCPGRDVYISAALREGASGVYSIRED
ncbi:MAG: MBL fold metallo-hydrolase [Clostridia bacterium]|nr:MBL fold metallo-hydrolase [Clostridia bacterium]